MFPALRSSIFSASIVNFPPVLISYQLCSQGGTLRTSNLLTNSDERSYRELGSADTAIHRPFVVVLDGFHHDRSEILYRGECNHITIERFCNDCSLILIIKLGLKSIDVLGGLVWMSEIVREKSWLEE